MKEYTRLFEFVDKQLSENPLETCMARKADGEWVRYSSRDVKALVDEISRGLIDHGMGKDDKIAIISNNCPEWTICDLAIQQIGAISVPIYPTITVEEYEFIFEDAGVKLVFTGDPELHQKALQAAGDKISHGLFCFEKTGGKDTLETIILAGRQKEDIDLEPWKNSIKKDDIFSILYTSGTTGKPKGVMLSHGNLIANTVALSKTVNDDMVIERSISFLPLCHIFERSASFYYLYMGISVYFAESLEKIGDNMREVHPHMFCTVPRLLEKVFEKIMEKGSELTGIKRKLFFGAVALAEKYDTNTSFGFGNRIKHRIYDKLIFSKWREALGNEVVCAISGAAALQERLARIFWGAGIPILEGYGLSETSPGVTFNRMEDNRLGTVGPPMLDVEVKIAEDGEVLTKGPNLMKGYYRRPDLTSQVIDEEGWFHTGDIGVMVDNKYLKITDRKKEMFKTSGGKYIAPQPIENLFKSSPFIEQIMVVGENRKHPSALIVPAADSLKRRMVEEGLEFSEVVEVIDHEKVQQLFNDEMERLNATLAQYEKIKKFKLVKENWSVETGELTPTMKLKRRIIFAQNEVVIEEFYKEARA